MNRFIDALKARGFKVLNPRGSEFRANRLFKREGLDTITVQVELAKEFRHFGERKPPHVAVDVFSTSYSKRRGRRNYDTSYLICGGVGSTAKDPDYYLEYETFGDAEEARVLQMIDAAITFTERTIAQDAEDSRIDAARFEHEKPENWDEMTRHERFMWEHNRMMAGFKERAELRKAILEGEKPEGWDAWPLREQNMWVGDRMRERLAAKLA